AFFHAVSDVGTASLLAFFFRATTTAHLYTLSLHDALPISTTSPRVACWRSTPRCTCIVHVHERRPSDRPQRLRDRGRRQRDAPRSEEHTSELQSPCNLVCRLLLEKKKKPLLQHRAAHQRRP